MKISINTQPHEKAPFCSVTAGFEPGVLMVAPHRDGTNRLAVRLPKGWGERMVYFKEDSRTAAFGYLDWDRMDAKVWLGRARKVITIAVSS